MSVVQIERQFRALEVLPCFGGQLSVSASIESIDTPATPVLITVPKCMHSPYCNCCEYVFLVFSDPRLRKIVTTGSY